MGAKRPDRRGFLKNSAALAGGLTIGAAAPALGQEQHHGPEMIKEGKDHPAATPAPIQNTSPPYASPTAAGPRPITGGSRFMWPPRFRIRSGAITPSSLHWMGTTRGSFLPDVDPREHRLMIHGMVDRPLTFTIDELKRLPSVTRIISSSARETDCHAGRRRSRDARHDELRRMDRRAPVDPAQGVRPERRGNLVRRGRRGGSEGRVEHADCQGDGRHLPGLRHERRSRAAAARVSAAADGSRLRRYF